MAGRAELQRRLATEFERQGWPYEPDIGPALLDYIGQTGPADGATLAQRVSADFLERHRISRDQMAAALDRAVGAATVEREDASSVTLNFTDNRYAVQVSDGGSVVNSTVNTAGTQLVVAASSSRDEVLAAVATLVRAGLDGEWDEDQVRSLSELVDARDDIGFEEVRAITMSAVRDAPSTADFPLADRAKVLVGEVSTGAISGALGTGIVAALGALF